jgi:hypothetical protein
VEDVDLDGGHRVQLPLNHIEGEVVPARVEEHGAPPERGRIRDLVRGEGGVHLAVRIVAFVLALALAHVVAGEGRVEEVLERREAAEEANARRGLHHGRPIHGHGEGVRLVLLARLEALLRVLGDGLGRPGEAEHEGAELALARELGAVGGREVRRRRGEARLHSVRRGREVVRAVALDGDLEGGGEAEGRVPLRVGGGLGDDAELGGRPGCQEDEGEEEHGAMGGWGGGEAVVIAPQKKRWGSALISEKDPDKLDN